MLQVTLVKGPRHEQKLKDWQRMHQQTKVKAGPAVLCSVTLQIKVSPGTAPL